MIDDKLKSSIKRINQLYQAENDVDDIKKQKENEKMYRDLVNELKIAMGKVNYAKSNLHFQISDETRANLIKMIEDLNIASETEIIDTEPLYTAKIDYKNASSKLRQDWNVFYSSKIRKTKGTTEIIRGLTSDPNKIDRIQNNIKMAGDWDRLIDQIDGKSKLELFKESLEETDNIMNSLQLSEDVMEFLNLVSREKADLTDLNKTVMDWISAKGLQGMFEIRFAVKK